MKISALLYGLLLASAHDNYLPINRKGKNDLHPDDIKIAKKKPIPKGCQKFNINGIEIIATNEKNAIRKYNSLNNIK